MEIYDKAALYVNKPEFRRWQDNPEEPRDWTGAAIFLGLTGADAFVDPVDRLEEIRAAIQAALDWCTAQDTVYLTRATNSDNPIHVSDLANVLDFLVALTYRFPETLEKSAAQAEHKDGEDGRGREAVLGLGLDSPLRRPLRRREPHPRRPRVLRVRLDADPLPLQPLRHAAGRVAARERVEHHVPRIGQELHEELDQRLRHRGRMPRHTFAARQAS